MASIAVDAPKTTQLLMGNEAIARGALEAGIGVATAYPGTPSSEIIGTLAEVAKELGMYVEWSINEKVATEVAAAASFSGVRALSAMKQAGLNVALDFVANICLSGTNSGLVFVVCDDPGAISSTEEEDSRHVAKMLDLPLLEPATSQEAKDMVKWGFELSEEIGGVCIIRSVTRISHGRGNVILGELPKAKNRAHFDLRKPYSSIAVPPSKSHRALHETLGRIEQIFEPSPFNWYVGPEKPELLIITCGSGWLYSMEAVKLLSVEGLVGILKLGTTWPLPRELVHKHVLDAENVLVVEEIDAFLENNVKELVPDLRQARTWTFYGKGSGHINPFGEISPDIVIKAIASILNVKYLARETNYQEKSEEIVKKYVLPRGLQFCAGCPHRATFWAIKDALRLDGRDGFVTGDIGCYGMAALPTGFAQSLTSHAMGSGVGVGEGLGTLKQFGFNQPVLAACGDSTFFHGSIPALINGIHSGADFILLFLDNAGTAMTGFQPHPGTSVNAAGDLAPAVDIESLCQALGVRVVVADPYDVNDTTKKLLDMLCDEGKTRVFISRRECALIRAKREKPLYKVYVNPDKCIGEACGCNRFCTRIFKCPGLIWDRDAKKARIDEAICSGCGVCVDICPRSAIVREGIE
jgi:indolepyruvate ferredoxin oxidoreductase alpha subunit